MTGRLLKLAVAAVLPIALSSCFLTPGAFTSSLELKRDGTFAFAYKGEMVFQSPEDMMKFGEPDAAWSDDQVTCYKDVSTSGGPNAEAAMRAAADAMNAAANAAAPASNSTSGDKTAKPGNATTTANAPATETEATDEGTRPCTKAEIAAQKKDWEDSRKAAVEKRKKDAAQFGAIFGYTPGDDAANRKLATTIMGYEGWKSVVYKGDGVFDVDYAITARLDHDYVFPLIPKADIIVPFVSIKRQRDGSARVSAPALIGGGMRALASRMKGLGAAGGVSEVPASAKTKGIFTITTDGDVLTNNTDDGPTRTSTGRQLMWDIGPDSEKVPEALVRLR